MKSVGLWSIALLMAILSACVRRPLEDMEDMIRLKVIMKVNGINNVTTNIYNEKIPVPDVSTGMVRALFYTPEGDRLINQSFISETGVTENGDAYVTGYIKALPGEYKLLCYNFDTETTKITEEGRFEGITAYAPEVSDYLNARFEGSRGQYDKIHYEPDHLMVAREENLRISPHTSVTTIVTEAASVIDTYYLQIYVEGGQYASSASAILTGLSASNKIGPNHRESESPTAVYFDLVRSDDKGKEVLCTTFNCFGKIEEATSNLNVTFDVLTKDGQKLQKTFNLDKVFQTEDARERHWLLMNDTLHIPKPITPPSGGGGGFKPGVSDWDEEQKDIEI